MCIRTVEILQIAGTMAGIFASIVMSMEGNVIKYFQKKNAVSTDSAIQLPDYKKIKKWRANRLISNSVLICNESGEYYYDHVARNSMRKKRLMVIIPTITILIGIILLVHNI